MNKILNGNGRADAAPLVSICIPCFNAEQYVAEAIESALAQTHPNIEVVVVDDGSTDGSLDVIRSFGESIIWESGPNRGGCAARNRALALSQGEYIQFLDADDRIVPHKVERQLTKLLEDGADMVLCKGGVFGDAGGPREGAASHPRPVGDPFLYFAKFPIGSAAPIHRRVHIERVGGFRVGLRRGQEWDMHLRLAAYSPRLSLVDEILLWVRLHDGPRVTSYVMSPPERLSHLLTLAADIEKVSQEPARREWLGRKIFEAARSVLATGDRPLAEEGFRRAVALNPNVASLGRQSLVMLRRAVGLSRAERIAAAVRPVFRRAN